MLLVSTKLESQSRDKVVKIPLPIRSPALLSPPIFLSCFSVSKHSEATIQASHDAVGQCKWLSLMGFATLFRQNYRLGLVSLHGGGWFVTFLSSHSQPCWNQQAPKECKATQKSHLFSLELGPIFGKGGSDVSFFLESETILICNQG